MPRKGLLFVGTTLVVVEIAGMALIGSGFLAAGRPANTAEGRGEWIFRTGTELTSGQPIPRTGGMMMANGQGLRTPLFTSPNITYQNLNDPSEMLEPDGSRGPTYTDEQIMQAITQGTDADGQPLA